MNTLYEVIVSEKPEYLNNDSCVVSLDEIMSICNSYCAMKKEGKILRSIKNVNDILLCLSEVFGLTITEMKQKCRKPGNVTARQMFYKYTCDNKVLSGLRQRGLVFKQDHSTVLHGKRKINDLLYAKDHYATMMWNKFNLALQNQQSDDNTRTDL